MKKTTLFSFLFAAAAACSLFLYSCEPAKPELDLGQIRTEIQAMENAYSDALNADDANAIMTYYADDAVSLANDEPAAEGKAAILESIQKEMAQDTLNTTQSFEVVDIFASGNLVVETGKTTIKDAEGNVVSTGKYMSLFEKRDGKYVCIRDIFNNDQK